MQHIVFEKADSHDVALLIKPTGLVQASLEQHYTDPLKKLGIKTKRIIAFDLAYGTKKKPTVAIQRAYLADLMPILKEQGVKVIAVADGDYFKTLTGMRKTDPHHGYVMDCTYKGFEEMKIILMPNYQGLFFNPDLQTKIDMGVNTLADQLKNQHVELGTGIIHSCKYLRKANEVYAALQDLKQYKELTCDTETLSLKFYETGIVTIAFAWDKHNGITIWCDDYAKPNSEVRKLLKDFFYTYTGTLIYHNANYDMKIIVNTLFMEDLLDEKGKQEGIEILTRKFHDTKLITYLATNSCAGNNLKLKDQAHEFAGNYAQDDIKDITLIPPEELEEYNLVDCLATWYVFDKYFLKMVEDKQMAIYEDIMKPSVKIILQMELTGLPVSMKRVKEARKVLENDIKECTDFFENSSLIQQFSYILREQAMDAANAKLKKKVKPIEDFADFGFNPNSNPNLQQLMYDFLDFPVIDKTAGGAPAAGADTLRKLVNHTKDPEKLGIIEKLINFFAADKILNTFVTAFEAAVLKSDGWYYVHGNFNIGGTVSGRLSSSGP